MGRDLEKGIKRFLKRRVKITLGFIVAFLLSCSFAMGEGLVITEDDNGKILFNGKEFNEENHQFAGNSFDGNIYTNNNIIQVENIPEAVIIEANKDFIFENNNFISLETQEEQQTCGIIVAEAKEFNNKGKIEIKTTNNSEQRQNKLLGIYINTDNVKINNDGIIKTGFYGENQGWLCSNYGILADGQNVEINNNGLIYSEYLSDNGNVYAVAGNNEEPNLINNGIIFSSTKISNSNVNGATVVSYVKEIDNIGTVISFVDSKINGDVLIYETDIVNNKGKLLGDEIGSDLTNVNNEGMIFSNVDDDGENDGIIDTVNRFENKGTIAVVSESGEETKALRNFKEKSFNYGVISADMIFYTNFGGQDAVKKLNLRNLGMYIDKNGKLLKYVGGFGTSPAGTYFQSAGKQEEDRIGIGEKREVFVGKDTNSKEVTDEITNDSGKVIINAGSIDDGTVQSIKSETIKNLSADKGYILNGYNETVVLNSATGNKDINNSVINAVKNAVTFEGDNLTLGLNNTTVNGGYGEDIISGDDNVNNLNFSGETIINGNVNLNGGNDKLSLDNIVQINGTLDGGAGDEDILTFNSSVTKSSSDKNINILYDIKGFEKTDIDTNVTLFEKTVNDNGDIKNLVAGLGDITIQNNGKLTLRVDGTEKEGDKITGHALYRNDGSLQTDKTGKLVLGLYGVGNEAVVAFGGTKIENLNSDNVETSSYLHSVKVNGSENVIEVSAKKDLEDLDIANYDKLNKIYHSILNSQNLDKFIVEEEQKGAFFKYLHDIYAGNPYAYSSELSRKTMDMMRNLADRDLHPELNKWSIYGGLTHIDGGTKESFYGRNYYGYDTGSRDIETDTKITGGYFKAEYGKAENLITGLIFGGNSAESEVGSSKVEGDSFYFGGYAKKFVNDFKFTLGAGFQHGDYKADRTAVGYEGVLKDKTSQKYDSNYHDRGFDIYGDIRYSREIGDNLCFEPSFTLSYTYLDQDGAAENGTLAIETDSKNFDYLSSEINLDVRKTILADKLTHSFIAGISYERLLNGYDEEYITGRVIGGTDFDILVPEKEKDNFLLNAKYELETEKGMLFDIKCSYRFEHDNNQDEWTVGAGVGYKF